MEEIVLRSAGPDDKNAIYAIWQSSVRFSSPFTGLLNFQYRKRANADSEFNYWFSNEIKKVIQKSEIIIAALKEDPYIIIGFLVFDREFPLTIHFCYVKKAFRNNGIAKEMIDHAKIDLKIPHIFSTHTSDMKWIQKKYPMLIYQSHHYPRGQ